MSSLTRLTALDIAQSAEHVVWPQVGLTGSAGAMSFANPQFRARIRFTCPAAAPARFHAACLE
ncbi:MAG TPA: hypothetical protein VL285_08420 [Bryobacteraceae bacterium]|jgi:hypothetical protein|nr:hypothetical protein [Bryobacteraceae bacterium]